MHGRVRLCTSKAALCRKYQVTEKAAQDFPGGSDQWAGEKPHMHYTQGRAAGRKQGQSLSIIGDNRGIIYIFTLTEMLAL